MRLTPRQRLALIDHINALVKVDFERLVFTLDVPTSVLPSNFASQGDCSISLLCWVQAPSGCGLPELLDILGAIAPLPPELAGLSPTYTGAQGDESTLESPSKTITISQTVVERPFPEQTFEFDMMHVDKRAFPVQTFEFDVVRVDKRGEIVERQRSKAVHAIANLGNGVTLEMVKIPGGSFEMGSSSDELDRLDWEGPQHLVSVPSFWIGRYPITQAQWRAIASMPQMSRGLEPEPSYFKGDQYPVEQVSWNDAVEACARLSAYTSHLYRLPSEAEWEYACRAGTTIPFHVGETITTELANYRGKVSYAGEPTGEYRETTTAVETFPYTNGFGLFDMHGNVWEWCQDEWHGSYEGAPTDGSAWQETPPQSNYRVIRSGSWINFPRYCRSASRYYDIPYDRFSYLGFRVVLAPR